MNIDENYGFQEDPRNGYGIIRSRTTAQIRSWEIPRSQKALEVFDSEVGKLDSPGLYILFAGKSKVYIGEAKDLYNRLKTHTDIPEDKIKEWDRVIVINDGRPATQSILNDNVIRKTLELYLINLFKANKYIVVAQGEPQQHNPLQKYYTESFKKELNFFLMKKNLITKLIDDTGQEEVFGDELKQILRKNRLSVTDFTAYSLRMNGLLTYIRPGSKKPKGWQITFRGSFLKSLREGNGNLLFSRDGLPLIPLKEIRKIIDSQALNRDTVDVFIKFTDNKIALNYKEKYLDITIYKSRK